ncbi:MAG: LCP family protein [Planctomycetes bacterium]|nr:LCP family protein [Planctomycetota bacterium]
MGSTQPHVIRRRPALDRLSLGLLIGFIILAIVTAVMGFYVVRELINSWNMTNLPGVPDVSAVNPAKTPEGIGTPSPTSEAPLQSMGGSTAVPWDGASRVNVLLMGLDYRDWESNEKYSRTDSMILLTIDPVTKTAGMLSIPRDMWVNIPGFDYGKINTAYFLGDSQKVPGGGPALAMATVEQFLGVPIQYYATIDFEAFVKFIDSMGGLTINVPKTVHVSLVGKSGIFDIKPGVQNLDGATTLAYARNRYTDGDDFDRAKRQQDVIMAIRRQVLDFNMLPTLISKAPTLYKEISAGIRTNLTLDQVIRLALLGAQVNSIKNRVIGTDSILFSTSPDGLSILIPIPDKVRLVRDTIFTIKGPVGPAAAAAGNPAVLMAEEKSRISVQNGTQSAGLATQTSEYLKSMKLNVVEEKNADQTYDSSIIIIYTGKPYTIKYLADLMKISSSHIFNRFNPDSQVDVAVIVGNDWANKNPMP